MKNKKMNRKKMILLLLINKAILIKDKILSMIISPEKLMKLYIDKILKKMARIKNYKKDILNRLKMNKILGNSQGKNKKHKIIDQIKTF